jgi:hypothetical protein
MTDAARLQQPEVQEPEQIGEFLIGKRLKDEGS